MCETPSDGEIVAAFEARNEDALALAEKKYGAYCKSVALRILGNAEDAEECLNGALFAAWNSIPPEKPACLRLYLAKLVRSAALHRYEKRSAAKRGGGELPAVLDELAECIPDGETPEGTLLAAELTRAVERFLRGLPKKDRALFLRRFFFTESLREIALRFGMREGTAAVSLHRTRKKLKTYLEKEGFLEK